MRDLWRKRNRLMGYDYSSDGVYFVTCCAVDGECLFRDRETLEYTDAGRIVEERIGMIESVYPGVTVEKYVVMPNHIHMVLLFNKGNDGKSLSTVMQTFKAACTKAAGQKLWHTSFHDHIIRSEDEYKRIWEYIDNNPLRWNEDCYYTEEG